MVSRELAKLVEDLSQRIEDARDRDQPSERNEEWTKMSLIVPLLEGLGWDRGRDVGYENSPRDVEGRLDLILKGHHLIGIEAKALDVPFPQDYDHPHIKKGLRQSKERGASYFIWTNGDCWQFSSLALANAPIYEVILSSARGGAGQVDSVADKLRIIEKERFTANPKIFDEEIRNNWKTRALPAAWDVILEKHTNDLLQLIRKGLPTELDVKSEEILEFLRTLKQYDGATEHLRRVTKQPERTREFPDEWKELLDSDEPEYEQDRKRFRSDPNRKLAQYLISEEYKEWSKKNTWKHAGIPKERAKRSGPVITLFSKWRFIEKAEGRGMYKRVEDSFQYLKKLLD